jgi:hypothetical protein
MEFCHILFMSARSWREKGSDMGDLRRLSSPELCAMKGMVVNRPVLHGKSKFHCLRITAWTEYWAYWQSAQVSGATGQPWGFDARWGLRLSYAWELKIRKQKITAQGLLGHLATVSGRKVVMRGGHGEGEGLSWDLHQWRAEWLVALHFWGRESPNVGDHYRNSSKPVASRELSL